MEVINEVRGTQHPSKSQSLVREGECSGGCSVERSLQQQRLDAVSDLGSTHLSSLRKTSGGYVCDGGKHSTSNVLLQEVSPTSLEDRCLRVLLDRVMDVRLPSMVPNPQSFVNPEGHRSRLDPGSALLAESTVVSPSSGTPSGPSPQVPGNEASTDSEEGPSLVPRSSVSSSYCLEVVRNRLQAEGLPSEIANMAALARRSTTTRTYDSRLDRFKEWAIKNSCHPLEASLKQISTFLMLLFSEGKQVNTIRNYRSAIAAVHSGFEDGSTIGNNVTIGLLLRGMFNERPPIRRLAPSWSINSVLEVLTKSPYEPLQNIPLELLTYKVLFLIAAASARRRGSLHALTIKPDFLRFEPGGVRLLPDPLFLAKNQSVSFTPEEIFFRLFLQFHP